MQYLINIFFAILFFLSFLPFNYFFDENFNAIPLQILIIIFLTIVIYKINFNNILLILSSFAALLLASNVDFTLLLSSPITASFIVIYLILISTSKKQTILRDLNISLKKFKRISNILLIIIIIFTMYFNIDFYFNHDLNTRSKAFGSGTVYSIISLYFFTFIYILYKNNAFLKRSNNPQVIFYVLVTLFSSTLLLTQSRGIAATVLFVFLTIEFKELKKIAWSRIVFVGVFAFLIIDQSALLSRFNIEQFENLNHLTSGRSNTQFMIIKSVFMSNDKMILFLGHGINSLEALYAKGFEYPHFDLLFLLYEGGIILVTSYVILIYNLYKIHINKIIFLIYILSSFHSNTILLPGFLMLGIFLDRAIEYKKLINNT